MSAAKKQYSISSSGGISTTGSSAASASAASASSASSSSSAAPASSRSIGPALPDARSSSAGDIWSAPKPLLGTLRPPPIGDAHKLSLYTWSTFIPLPFIPLLVMSASEAIILPTANGIALPSTRTHRFCPTCTAPRPSSGTMTPGSIMSAPAERSFGSRNLDTGPWVTSSSIIVGSLHSVKSVG